jgi:hypothetical protein
MGSGRQGEEGGRWRTRLETRGWQWQRSICVGAAHVDGLHHVPLLHDAPGAIPLLHLGAHRHARLAPPLPAASASAVEKLKTAME